MIHGQADFDPADFERREAADKSVYVKFYVRPVIDESETAKQGRPIFNDREYVEIRTPGNQTNVIQRPVSDMDRARFSQAYRAFKAGNDEQMTGTPLTEVPWITRSQVEELSHLRIRTLEHLANVGDDVCTRVPGLYSLKDRAKMAIEKAVGEAPMIEMQRARDEMMNEMVAMRQAMAEQAKIIENLKKEKAKT